ncbi:MAG TPA: hypothetical protein VE338_02135 [Ktedonobacterales bacterium]|jgi:hypothetical protein|nr:hypothetical protein [Ktedonobacterales bacterium]
MATATTTTRTPTVTDAKARSLVLATAHGQTSCSWAAKTLGWTLDETTGELVSLALAISSATSDETVYAVGYRAAADDAECECPAAQHGRGCWHRGLAMLAGRSIARCYSPAGRRENALEESHDGAHHGAHDGR